jgi:hypothetical protein
MKRISSRQTRFLKYGFPVLMFGLAVAIVSAMILANRRVPVPWVVIVSLPLLMLALGAVLMKTLILDLADEVHDAGDHLVVRKGDITERVPLKEIVNVGWTVMINPPRVTLTLRKPGRLGREIVFSPRQPLVLLGRNPLVMELIERVDAARRG